jgi:hypothetical protein
MAPDTMIPVHEFCLHHNIEQSFIYSLKDSGLVEFITVEETIYVPENLLPQLEKLVRLYEMDINLEGIETITYLLNRIHDLQRENLGLANRLRMYEKD